MELVKANFHRAIAHTGPAAPIRAALRLGSGRAVGLVNIYLIAREIGQAGGLIRSDYTVVE